MEDKQKINCTVSNCEYNNHKDHDCSLKEITVSEVEENQTHNPDESMCSSYSCDSDK